MESDLWKTMRREVGPLGDIQRIENLCRNGMPDTNGCIRSRDFWVELKWLASWPKEATRIVLLPKYRQEQRIWIRRRIEAGARNVFILLQVDTPRTYVLMDGWFAVHRLGFVSRASIEAGALLYHEGTFPTERLVALLRQER